MPSEDSGNATRNASPPTQSKKTTPKHKFEGHEDQIWSFVFLHDNEHIVSSSEDGTMRKWDCNTGLLVGNPWKEKGGSIMALAVSPNGKTIACGREDGRVQRWNTEGKMIEGIWMGHTDRVWSVSWSPSGGHIASGSDDGTILIRTAESGKVEVGPIKTGQNYVYSLAYSPSGDRIASGGDKTICIWDSNSGRLLVGPIEDLGTSVTSVVWSSDSSKLYSASEKFARVFDSVSGTQLHRFEHNYYVNSIALSSKDNLLACVGTGGIAQLWDTESHQPLRDLFSTEDSVRLECVSFSRDGRYLAYGGNDKKITLWPMVEDLAPHIALPAPTTQDEPAPLSFLDIDATKPFAGPGGDDIEDGHDDPYNANFFQSSPPSLHSSSSGPSLLRRWLRVLAVASPLHTPADESVPLQERLKSRFRPRRARSPPSPLKAPASNKPAEPTPDGKVTTGKERNKDVDLPDCSANIVPGAAEQNKGKQREDLADPDTHPTDDASSTSKFDPNENVTIPKFLRALALGKYATTSQTQMTPCSSPKVVEVSASRKQQVYVTCKPKPASGSSQAGPYSHGQPAHGNTPSLGQAGISPQSGSLTPDGPSVSDSINGSWNKFLVLICFPCGR